MCLMMAQGQQERDTAEIQLHSNLTTPYWVPTACLYCLSPVQNGLSKEPLNFLSFLFLLILVWCPFRTCVWWWPKANRTEILHKFSFTQIWSFKRQAWLVSSSLFKQEEDLVWYLVPCLISATCYLKKYKLSLWETPWCNG